MYSNRNKLLFIPRMLEKPNSGACEKGDANNRMKLAVHFVIIETETVRNKEEQALANFTNVM